MPIHRSRLLKAVTVLGLGVVVLTTPGAAAGSRPAEPPCYICSTEPECPDQGTRDAECVNGPLPVGNYWCGDNQVGSECNTSEIGTFCDPGTTLMWFCI